VGIGSQGRVAKNPDQLDVRIKLGYSEGGSLMIAIGWSLLAYYIFIWHRGKKTPVIPNSFLIPVV
jgi:hypothetical protein